MLKRDRRLILNRQLVWRTVKIAREEERKLCCYVILLFSFIARFIAEIHDHVFFSMNILITRFSDRPNLTLLCKVEVTFCFAPKHNKNMYRAVIYVIR